MINVFSPQCHQGEEEHLAVDAAKVTLAAIDLPLLAPLLQNFLDGFEDVIAHDAGHDVLHGAVQGTSHEQNVSWGLTCGQEKLDKLNT